MKQILIITFSCFLGQVSFAQTDSVYLSISSKLISDIQIITEKSEYGIRENYTYFKYRYWLGEIDTVSMSIISRNESLKSKKNKIEYLKYGACDSIINHIRNSSKYWNMLSEIDKMARKEIGYNNEDFNQFKYSKRSRIENFSEKCQDEFEIEVSELKGKLLKEINRIKEGKFERFIQFKSKPESIDSIAINSFLETFDLCESDLKALELIILNKPNDFVTSIDKMSDSDFFAFTLKLDDLPEELNISKMKETLKESGQRSKRKKKMIRKLKKTKG